MVENPKVSVIIPFYSTIDGLLIKSVSSALSQSYRDLEVVVIDDASPLKAEDQLSTIKDGRLKVIRHEINKNGAIARNTGIKNSKGEFVAFLDYDDIWYEDKIYRQLRYFESLGGSDKNVIYSKCKIISGNRIFYRPRREIKEGENVARYLFCEKELIQTSGIFLKKKTVEKVMFDDIKRHQDYQLCLSLQGIGCFFNLIEEPLYEFNQIEKKADFEFSYQWFKRYLHAEPISVKKCFLLGVVIRAKLKQGFYREAFDDVKKFDIDKRQFLKVCLMIFLKKIYHMVTVR